MDIYSHENRVKVACHLCNLIRDDVDAGRYSALGRPNLTSVQLVLALPDDELHAQGGSEFEKYLNAASGLMGAL